MSLAEIARYPSGTLWVLATKRRRNTALPTIRAGWNWPLPQPKSASEPELSIQDQRFTGARSASDRSPSAMSSATTLLLCSHPSLILTVQQVRDCCNDSRLELTTGWFRRPGPQLRCCARTDYHRPV